MAKKRTRNASRIDELPEHLQRQVSDMLADVTVTYQQIADAVTKQGYPLSKSSVGRYAARLDKAMQNMDRARAQAETLIKRVRENQDIESTEIASTLLMDGLIQRLLNAGDDYNDIPLDKAGRLITSIQRSAAYKSKVLRDNRQLIDNIRRNIMGELSDAIQGDPELLGRVREIVNAAADREISRIDS